jgi:hypothetical protein
METKQTISLHFLRNDGRRERTQLTNHSLTQARQWADWVFRRSEGLYIEANICLEDGYVETVQNPFPTMADLSRI